MDPNIPEQITGAQTNTEYSITAQNKSASNELYQKARKRLLDING